MMNLLKKLICKKKNPKVLEREMEHLKKVRLSGNIDDNTARLKDIMNNSYDIKTRDVKIGGTGTRATIIYIDNLVNDSMVQENILKPLTIYSLNEAKDPNKISFKTIKDSMISLGDVQEADAFDEIVLAILTGHAFLCLQGCTKGLIIEVKLFQGRNVGKTNKEHSIKGPQEALVEILKTNIGLIRQRLRDPNLTFDSYKIGRRTKTDIVIAYIKGIVDMETVNEIKRRLLNVDIDGQTSAIQISQMIIDNQHSIFPMSQVTERPDKVVSSLIDGRVAVILEGAPDAIVLPVTLPILMKSADDYFENWIIASFIRISRYICLFISSLFPAIYIATVSFNPGMLPTNLTLSIAVTRVGVPFPSVVEALLMEFTLEILLEAGLRLPKVVGQTVSIVGGLVIGQSAVQAGLVSPIMVIIVSLTAVASFTIPDYSLGMTTRFLRLPFMLLAVTFGSFGIAMGMLMLLTYLCSLKSFGIRYLSPITPFSLRDWTDTFIRGPYLSMNNRPEFLNPDDNQRSKRIKFDEN